MPTNLERAFDERPGVYAAWRGLVESITENMELRRYELATFAAAQRLRSTYCSIMHGNVLRNEVGEDVLAIVNHRERALDAVDLAVMDLAERVVDDASSITDADLRRLRELGLTDTEIMDVVLAAAARCFFSKTLDALGVQADAKFQDLEPALKAAFVVGRPIAAAQ
jgi:alkylhydroperoxidase family enzyme